jgi:putative spermidine/putrescine transport system permease protein
MRLAARFSAYLQVVPLTLVFVGFLLFPLLAVVVFSFWDYTAYTMIPAFVLTNYRDVLSSSVTYTTYVNTFKYAGVTWFFTLTIGFTVAYFLAFHVRSFIWQLVLFLICTIPFLTSNIIRMISWVPFLGRHGIFNSTLQTMGLISESLEFLLFSDFVVVLAFVHLYTLFMVIPIFNSMMRIDRSLLAAAADCGASGG